MAKKQEQEQGLNFAEAFLILAILGGGGYLYYRHIRNQQQSQVDPTNKELAEAIELHGCFSFFGDNENRVYDIIRYTDNWEKLQREFYTYYREPLLPYIEQRLSPEEFSIVTEIIKDKVPKPKQKYVIFIKSGVYYGDKALTKKYTANKDFQIPGVYTGIETIKNNRYYVIKWTLGFTNVTYYVLSSCTKIVEK